MKTPLIFIGLSAILLVGCVGRTGKVGMPIAAYYGPQLAEIKLGETTPDDLQKIFTITTTNEVVKPTQPHPGQAQQSNQIQPFKKTKVLVSLKEAKLENGKQVEIYEVAKGGSMDVAAFVMWGYVAYNKDQELLFRFEDGKLVSYEAVVMPDPTPASVTPVSSPKHN
jgi:hypothetical protein